MLKRDLSYDLFSREPEDWVQWAGFARSPDNKGKKSVGFAGDTNFNPGNPVRTNSGSKPI